MNATRPRRRLFKKDRKRELCHGVVSFPFACNHYTARTTGYGLRSGEKPMLARGNSLFALLLSSLFLLSYYMRTEALHSVASGEKL